ncbi:MAG: low molecular weight phosphatase family protein [Pseudonocardia sp.]|nr:low molecular weight phosphatase family protein [Pseudonocardia sp.]
MAAGLMHHAAPEVEVHSAGTDPGAALNELSVEALGEVGIDISRETPKPVDPQLLDTVDLVITLGRDAKVDVPDGVELRNWDTDEPSERGIGGIERIRLVRDDIAAHVTALARELAADHIHDPDGGERAGSGAGRRLPHAPTG